MADLIKPKLMRPNQRQWLIGRDLNGGVFLEIQGTKLRFELSPDQACELAVAIFEVAGFKLEKIPPTNGLNGGLHG